jgi:hypothetical protein
MEINHGAASAGYIGLNGSYFLTIYVGSEAASGLVVAGGCSPVVDLFFVGDER